MKCNFRCRDISNCEKDKTKCEFCSAFRCLNCLTDKDNCHKSAEERFLEYIEEQTKIANFLSNIDNIIDKESKKLEELRQWKKGLFQQMFV